MRRWLDASDRCGIPPEDRSCHIVASVFTSVGSHRHSRNWIPFLNLGRLRNWENPSKAGSRKLFEEHRRCRPERRSFVTPFCPTGVARRHTLTLFH
jgi:hypothetical protein